MTGWLTVHGVLRHGGFGTGMRGHPGARHRLSGPASTPRPADAGRHPRLERSRSRTAMVFRHDRLAAFSRCIGCLLRGTSAGLDAICVHLRSFAVSLPGPADGCLAPKGWRAHLEPQMNADERKWGRGAATSVPLRLCGEPFAVCPAGRHWLGGPSRRKGCLLRGDGVGGGLDDRPHNGSPQRHGGCGPA